MITYESLSKDSRVWIYQSNRELTESESQFVESKISYFVSQWTSHQQELKAWGKLFHNRFIVIMVDENLAGASGCSIDKSVALVKEIEQHVNADFFDRFNFAYLENENIISVSKIDFELLFKEGKIDSDTFVFNNLVKTKEEFESKWKVKIKDSWHKNFV
jgi:hypothetical protein